jgi:HSP20 family protein
MSEEKQPFDPVEGLSSLRDSIRKAVDAGVKSITNSNFPAVDIYRSGDELVVQTAPLDGLDATTIDVEMVGQDLTVRGTTRNPNDLDPGVYLRRERNYGHFSRTLTIPVRVIANEARAKVKGGKLTITFPLETDGDDEVIRVQVTDS